MLAEEAALLHRLNPVQPCLELIEAKTAQMMGILVIALPVTVIGSNFSAITYTLSAAAPDSMFVSAASGEIFGTLDEPVTETMTDGCDRRHVAESSSLTCARSHDRERARVRRGLRKCG